MHDVCLLWKPAPLTRYEAVVGSEMVEPIDLCVAKTPPITSTRVILEPPKIIEGPSSVRTHLSIVSAIT